MKRISKILDCGIKLSSKDNYSIGILHGKMGICLSFFYIGYLLKDEKIINSAEIILDNILNRLHVAIPSSNLNDCVEFAIGIDFLINKNFIQCHSEDVLDDVEDFIFKKAFGRFDTNVQDSFSDKMLMIYYFLRKILYKSANSESHSLCKEFVIEEFNTIHHQLNENVLSEPHSYSIDYLLPFYLYLIAFLKSSKIYDYKANMIVDDLSIYVLTKIPISDCNKLYLLWGILYIVKQFEIKEWEKHADLLYASIDIDNMLYFELKSNHIFFENGISSVYFILNDLKNNFPKYSFEFNQIRVFEKIKNSILWDKINDVAYLEDHLALINGLLFPIIVMGHINRKELAELIN